jgi:hypothetical protein
MRPTQVWLLAAAVGIGIIIGLILNTDSQPDPTSKATASTTAGRAAISEFERLQENRLRALDSWTQALGGPFAAFLPISTRAQSEDRRIVEQAAALAGSCEAAEGDACRLLDALGDLADSEGVRLGNLERAKRLGRRNDAYAAFRALRFDNCHYAQKVLDLLDKPDSPAGLSQHLPALADEAHGIVLAACDRETDRAALQAARAAGVPPASWPPSTLRMDPPEREWRIYAAAVDRSAVVVEKVLTDLQRDLKAIADGRLPPEVFADVAGPDPIAAQAQLDPDAPESVKKDDTLIGRLVHAEQLVAELGPPADPDVRRAWQGYRGALGRYELAVQHAADGAVQDMQEVLAQANARAAPALAAFASRRR